MRRILFVTNGHGEAAIAKRIAADLRPHGAFLTEHFPLVGETSDDTGFAAVGPRRAMPSGGLVAMGNVGAFTRDIRAGFLALLGRQLGFLRGAARAQYSALVAVGDVYAFLLARLAGRPTVFVGTAKSVYVAPYGPAERRLLRTAQRIFVRDPATAAFLRARGVQAEAPGNVIVDLLATTEQVDWGAAGVRVALLPGSRERAYRDAAHLALVARLVMQSVPGAGVISSLAPGLDPERMRTALRGEPPIPVWAGDLGALLAHATLAVGQAGTANEAAAASGVPVVALDLDGTRKTSWYRMRQARLLGDALTIVTADPVPAARAIAELLADGARRERMAATGRERMGGRGGAAAIAAAIAAIVSGR